ncbi:hypothetical protein [Aliarcobacter skirrowii]|uniref:hypothetical protein n=1 Tax=Aliarcobacter skirrowii TaxID=28200 RepID=UPI002249574F|nr:hypothetical protein [Aliarcobacter skirrowii]
MQVINQLNYFLHKFKINYCLLSIDKIIEFNDKEVLKNNGTISYEQMKEMVEKVYKTFDNKRKKQEAIEADYIDLEELKKIENLAKSKKS